MGVVGEIVSTVEAVQYNRELSSREWHHEYNRELSSREWNHEYNRELSSREWHHEYNRELSSREWHHEYNRELSSREWHHEYNRELSSREWHHEYNRELSSREWHHEYNRELSSREWHHEYNRELSSREWHHEYNRELSSREWHHEYNRDVYDHSVERAPLYPRWLLTSIMVSQTVLSILHCTQDIIQLFSSHRPLYCTAIVLDGVYKNHYLLAVLVREIKGTVHFIIAKNWFQKALKTAVPNQKKILYNKIKSVNNRIIEWIMNNCRSLIKFLCNIDTCKCIRFSEEKTVPGCTYLSDLATVI